jgi:uncharacterized protein with HEPN domain
VKQQNIFLSQYEKQYTEIPWKKMAGMRDILIHEYDGVDIDRIWLVIVNDCPSLKIQVEKTSKCMISKGLRTESIS